MEHLHEAIERARQQREGTIGRTPVLEENDSANNAKKTARKLPARDIAPAGTRQRPFRTSKPLRRDLPLPEEVRYTKTRLVEPDRQLLTRNRVIAGDVGDPRVEAYRQLRSQVLDDLKRNNSTTLAITGANENAGKTLTAVNLAISISQEVNQTVLLVDLDLRDPSVHTTLGLEIDKGIIDHLLNGEPIENILVNPGYPRLSILPGLPQDFHVSEVLSSPAMKELLSEIVYRYPDRIIIFDLPPLLRNDDAMVFAPNADACLLVVEDGVTTRDDIERSLQLLKHSRVLGTVLNKAR
jgi:Mrp family chromosome partitioning ATPase